MFNDTPLSKIDSTVINSGSSTISSNNDNVVVISEGSSVLNHGGESAVSMGTSSSSSIVLATETSDASVSTSIRIFSIASNSETHLGFSTASAIAMPTTQAVIASQTILMPSSAVSKLVVADITLTVTDSAATIEDQVIFLQSGALIVDISTIFFMSAEGTVTVGDVVHSLPNNGALLVAETTIKPDASAVTIVETAVSLSFSNLVIEFSTIALASSPLNVIHTTSTAPITLYPSEIVTLNHTITQGFLAITISGIAISLGSTDLMIGSKISFLPFSSLDVVHTTSPQPVIFYPSEIVTLGHTITQGAPAVTISGIAISLSSTGLAIGSKTISISFSVSRVVFTIAGQVITPFANGVVIAGQTTSQGASAITMSGTVISLGPSGLVLGSFTISLLTQALSFTFVLDDHTFTANAAPIAIDGTTLTEGASAATIFDIPIFLGPSGVIIGSSTYALLTSLSSSVLIINGETFTINPTGVRVSDFMLAMSESAITIDGTRMSLGTLGLVVETSTIPYDDAASLHTTQEIEDAIMAGFGTTAEALSSTATGATTGAIANGTVPGETVYPPVSMRESVKMSLDSLFVAIVMPMMAFMVSLGG